MIYAYDKVYLSKAQNNIATMLDFAVYDLKEELSHFYQKFLYSKISKQLEKGLSTVIAGKSGIELALEIIGNENLAVKYQPVANRSPEYWCGWSLAYFQWETNLSFSEINRFIPISEVLSLYSPYHEMDISQFCDKMLSLYNKRKGTTNLKAFRIKAGLSQNELAKITDIPLRTIQQYEQNQKNINAAKVESVVKLAKALNISVEKLMEINLSKKNFFKKYNCPCCGRKTLKDEHMFEICENCGWEDDNVQFSNPDLSGGANELSLNQYKKKFFRERTQKGDNLI